jgi:hypothetical protein
MNLYGFANGDPINFSDPFGLCANPLECLLRGIARAILGSVGTTPEREVQRAENVVETGGEVGLCVAAGGLTAASFAADVSLVAGASAGGLAAGTGARAALGVIARESADAGITALGARELRAAGSQMAAGAAAVGWEVAGSVASRAPTAPLSGGVTAAAGGTAGEVVRDVGMSMAPFLGTAASIGQTAGVCRAIGR